MMTRDAEPCSLVVTAIENLCEALDKPTVGIAPDIAAEISARRTLAEWREGLPLPARSSGAALISKVCSSA
jgi:hypothetical protein